MTQQTSLKQVADGGMKDSRKGEDRFTSIKETLEKNVLPLLFIESTSRCNLKCSFCGMHSNYVHGDKSNKAKGHMSVAIFDEVIAKCHGMTKFKAVYLQGHGEPLLHPRIAHFIASAKEANIAEQIVLVTNGVLLTKEVFRKLSNAGATIIRVSLDIITPETFNKSKGVDACAKVVANVEECIKLLRDERPSTCLDIYCAEEEDETLGDETKRIVRHFKSLIEDLPNVRMRFRKMINWVDTVNRVSGTCKRSFTRPTPCEQLFYLFVHFDGDVSTCCSDTTKSLVIGNAYNIRSFSDILLSDRFLNQIEDSLTLNFSALPACRQCEQYSPVDSELFARREELLSVLRKRKTKFP